jgi:small subunit ribosomal protein S21
LATVDIHDGENIEIAIKRFRKEVEKENILKELKDRQYFHKPALIRKMERLKLEKRLKRKDRKRRRMKF